jgi:predicted extracellular nuclease
MWADYKVITHHPLSDLYLVYNDRRDTTSGQLLERAFIIKLTNLFNF